ncbi:MAG: hypothetical protein ACI4RN_02200, partial [Oscillospiraceae bacterium]
DTAFGSMSYKMEEFANNSIKQFGISKLAAKQTGSTFMAMASGMGLAQDNASDMAISLTGLSADMASFYNVSQDVASTALKSIFTGETETLKQFGIVMTDANLQAYALSQGISKSTSEMTQAEKVQLRYNYVMSQTALAQGDFAKTQDSWANQTRILQEQFKELGSTVGSVVMSAMLPVLQKLNGILSSLIDVAGRAAQAIANVFGIKMDSGSGGSAAKALAEDTSQISDESGIAADNYSDMADSAKETAKANERQLAAFDKINKLSSNTSDTKSLDKISTANNSGVKLPVTTEVKVDTNDAQNKIERALNHIKDLVKSGDWEGLGKLLAEKVNLLFDKIDWKAIQEKVKLAIKNFANFLNGFVRNLDWEKLGETIGEGLNTALTALYTFNTTFDWDALGTGIANSLNGMIYSIDWDLLGRTFASKINAIFGFLYGFVTTFDWSTFGYAISTAVNGWFDEIDWKKIGQTISEGIKGLLKSVKEFFKNLDAKQIADSIIEFLDGIDLKGILKELSETISEGLKTTLDFLIELVEGIDWEQTTKDLVDSICEFLEGIDWSKILSKIFELMGAAVGGCMDALKGLGEKIWDGITTGMDETKGYFQEYINDEADKNGWQFGLAYIKGIKNGIADAMKDFQSWFDDNIATPFQEGLESTFPGITEFYNKCVEKIKAPFKLLGKFFKWVWEEIKKPFKMAAQWFKDTFKGVADEIKTAFEKVWEFVKIPINWMIDGVNTLIRGLNEVSFDVPDWKLIPSDIRGKSIGFNIPEIPRLATGTVVPANYGEFLAVLGDNKREAEVVSPLSTMKQAVKEAISESGYGGGDIVIHYTAELDGQKLHKKMVRINKQEIRKTGKNPMLVTV